MITKAEGEDVEVIWESRFWKEDLHTQAETIEETARKPDLGEPELARFEQAVLLGFYSIRRLAESFKLSTATPDLPVQVRKHLATGKQVHRLNWHRLDEIYDMDFGTTETRCLRFMWNQFIHSYVFMPSFDSTNRVDGAYVCSDRDRARHLLFVSAVELVRVFRVVGADYPNRFGPDPKSRRGDHHWLQWMEPSEDESSAAD